MRAAMPLAIALALLFPALVSVAASEDVLLDAPLKGPNNTTVTLRTMLGKPLVVEFMASWCPACARQTSELKLLRARYSDNVTIVSVSDTPEALAELAAREGPTGFSSSTKLGNSSRTSRSTLYREYWS